VRRRQVRGRLVGADGGTAPDVTKLTNFGAFVELEPGLEGLLHISELADHKAESPEDVVKVGDVVEVKILRVDAADRKIGLSRKRLG
jgi:small subunit ribosomal protein S1